MAVIYAEQILARAKRGEEVTTEERRHCVAYLLERPVEGETTPTIAELAVIFKVSERTISFDKKKIKEQVAEETKGLDVELIIADLTMYHRKLIANIEKSAAKTKLGTSLYLAHQESLWKMQKDYVEGLQNLGVLPKELGSMSVEKYTFTASIGLNGSGRPLELSEAVKQPAPIEGEVVKPKELTVGRSDDFEKAIGTHVQNSSSQSLQHDIEGRPETGVSGQAGDSGIAPGAQLSAIQTDVCVGV